MLDTPPPVRAVLVAAFAMSAAAGCDRGRVENPSRIVAEAAGELPSCAGDSLRPAAAAPAPGLWVYERPSSLERVAALIGPPGSSAGTLVVTRPVETMEVRLEGDTIRARVMAASVTLELLPAIGAEHPGGAQADGSGPAIGAGATPATTPAATYTVSRQVRLAAYEPCATSQRGPRLRYLRRDSVGRIVTDVMLRRTSDQ